MTDTTPTSARTPPSTLDRSPDPAAGPTGGAAPALVQLTEKQLHARRQRSLALGIVLAALAVLFFVATLDKLGANLVGIDAIRDL